jgi:hypothetical protein
VYARPEELIAANMQRANGKVAEEEAADEERNECE